MQGWGGAEGDQRFWVGWIIWDGLDQLEVYGGFSEEDHKGVSHQGERWGESGAGYWRWGKGGDGWWCRPGNVTDVSLFSAYKSYKSAYDTQTVNLRIQGGRLNPCLIPILNISWY